MRDSRFERAVEEHGGRVYTLAVYLLGCGAEAEDLSQDVLLRLWRHLEELDPGKVRAWLLRVTRNACCDRLRQRRSRLRILGEVPLPERDPATPRRGPEAEAVASEFSDRVRSAVAELAEPMRSAVVLREIQGLSYREIAQVLDISESHVRVALHRGRKRLRECLREVYEHAAAS